MKILGILTRVLLIGGLSGGAFLSSAIAAGGDEVKDQVLPIGKAAAAKGKAEVLWGSTWYAAQVLEEKDGKFFIKYDGYGDNWNEWVGKDRIRFLGLPPARRQCEVEWHGTWFPAEVLKENEGKFYIKYDNYGDTWNEWVGKERIRFPDKAVAPVEVEVEWNGTWYPAKILEKKDGKFHIKYDGWGDTFNEWVGKERIRERARVPGKPVKEAAEVVPVEVESGGIWYPAKILEQKDGKFYIKYDGYTDASNEWVGKERIRLPAKAAPDKAAPDKGRAEVEWGGKWYPATILEKKDDKFHIKYDGYGDAFNEWVGPERIRSGKEVPKP